MAALAQREALGEKKDDPQAAFKSSVKTDEKGGGGFLGGLMGGLSRFLLPAIMAIGPMILGFFGILLNPVAWLVILGVLIFVFKDKIFEWIGKMIQALGKFLVPFAEGIGKFFGAISDTIGKTIGWIIDAFKGLWDGVTSVFKWYYNNVIDPVVKFFKSIGDTFTRIKEKISTTMVNIIKSIVNWLPSWLVPKHLKKFIDKDNGEPSEEKKSTKNGKVIEQDKQKVIVEVIEPTNAVIDEKSVAGLKEKNDNVLKESAIAKNETLAKDINDNALEKAVQPSVTQTIISQGGNINTQTTENTFKNNQSIENTDPVYGKFLYAV
jgi:hypothetical protein